MMTDQMKKPVIGITPLYHLERDYYWIRPGYFNIIEAAGAIPLLLPITQKKETLAYFLETLDGILFSGGEDINPVLYHEPQSEKCGELSELRDEYEFYLLSEADRRDLPAFGICRGMQLMNVYAGGTLYQDIHSEYPTAIEHDEEPPYHLPAHNVTLLKEGPLAQVVGKENMPVNSYHHQAVKKISDRFRPMAISEDGLTEAIYVPDKKCMAAVQWHPELSFEYDPDGVKILEWFVSRCK